MKPTRAILCLPALALALTAAAPADAFIRAKPNVKPAPPASYQGQWYTTPDGCSYSRAQAPGHAPMWVLIINPHHIGQPNAGRHCVAVLQARG